MNEVNAINPNRDTTPTSFDVLMKQKGFVIVFCLSAIATALLLTYIYSEKYEAMASIFYQPLEVTRHQGVNTQALGSPVPAPPFKIVGKTLEEVLLSNAILKPIVKKYDLDNQIKIYTGPWYSVLYKKSKDMLMEYAGDAWSILKHGRVIEDDPEISAIKKLRKNVKIKNKDSYIFHILVRDKSPERAALIADDLAKGLVLWLKDKARKPSIQKLEQIKSLLTGNSQKISEYSLNIQTLLEQNNIASIDRDIEKATDRLSELEMSKIAINKKIYEDRAKLKILEKKIQLKNRSVGGTGNKQFTKTKQNYINPENLKKLKSENLFLMVDLEGTLAEKASLLASIKKLNDKISHLPLIQNKIRRYEMDLRAAQADYARLNESYHDAMMRATGVLSEAKFLNMAVVPIMPVAPIMIYHTGLAGILSLFVSIGLVYLFSYYNIRIFFTSLGVAGRSAQAKKEITPKAEQEAHDNKTNDKMGKIS